MKNAILKAIEGGYENLHYLDTQTEWQGQYKILLDPSFWKSLGKAIGLDETPMHAYGDRFSNRKRTEYELHWHNFIDHIADGGDVDEFFNNLINK